MPELPDVETFRRHAASTSLHQAITRVHVSDERLLENTTPQALGRQLNQQQFEETQRHGKYLLMNTKDQSLVLHFGMSGSLQYVKDADLPPYTRAEFHFASGGCLAYLSRRLLGHIFLVQDRCELVRIKHLGPDALDVARDQFCQRFQEKRGSLKSALMDQSVVAGIGNLYSDEILFQLPLHPQTDVQDLDKETLQRLYEVCHRVLKTAIRHHADPDQLPRRYLLPHRHQDGRCPNCGTTLEKTSVGGRSAVFCPQCQTANSSKVGSKH